MRLTKAHDVRRLRLCAHCQQPGLDLPQLTEGRYTHARCLVKADRSHVDALLGLPTAELHKVTLEDAGQELMKEIIAEVDARAGLTPDEKAVLRWLQAQSLFTMETPQLKRVTQDAQRVGKRNETPRGWAITRRTLHRLVTRQLVTTGGRGGRWYLTASGQRAIEDANRGSVW